MILRRWRYSCPLKFSFDRNSIIKQILGQIWRRQRRSEAGRKECLWFNAPLESKSYFKVQDSRHFDPKMLACSCASRAFRWRWGWSIFPNGKGLFIICIKFRGHSITLHCKYFFRKDMTDLECSFLNCKLA